MHHPQEPDKSEKRSRLRSSHRRTQPTQALPGSLQSTHERHQPEPRSMFQGDEGIANEFAGLVQSYATLRGLNAMPNPNAVPGQGYGNLDTGFVQPGQDNAADNQFDLFNLEGSGGY